MIQIQDSRFPLGKMNLGDYMRERAEFDYIKKQIFYKAQYNRTHTKRKRDNRQQKALSEQELNKQVIEVIIRDNRQ